MAGGHERKRLQGGWLVLARGAFAVLRSESPHARPQLAAFAAFLGIPTTLVVGPQQDTNATAMLRTACTAPVEPSARSGNLRVTVSDQYHAGRPLPADG